MTRIRTFLVTLNTVPGHTHEPTTGDAILALQDALETPDNAAFGVVSVDVQHVGDWQVSEGSHEDKRPGDAPA